jgi:putative oxidoreductase
MHKFFPQFVTGSGAVGLLLVRVVMGAAFMFHGWSKIQSPGGVFGWMGKEAPIPGPLQGMAVLAEFGGGLALIPGFMTPLAAFGIAITMIVAFGTVHVPSRNAFVAPPGKPSFELVAVFFANAVLLILVGPGKLSLDALLFANKVESRRGPGTASHQA